MTYHIAHTICHNKIINLFLFMLSLTETLNLQIVTDSLQIVAYSKMNRN